MRVPTLLPHTITVRPYIGAGPYDDRFGEPVTVRTFVADGRRLAITPNGEELVSESTVYTGPYLSVPVGSAVTVWPGTRQERTARVITVARYDHPAAGSHLEINLT